MIMSPPNLEKCPVCRAGFRGDEPFEQPCRRCKSDLIFVRSCYYQATQYQIQAQIALARGEYQSAVRLSALSLNLVDEPSIRSTHTAAQLANFLATRNLVYLSSEDGTIIESLA